MPLLKHVILIFAFGLLFNSTTTAQTLDRIKQSSDDHNSGSSSSNDYSESDDGGSDGGGVDFLFFLLDEIVESSDGRSNPPSQPREERYESDWTPVPRVNDHSIECRRAIDNRKVLITNAQYNLRSNNYFLSTRYNLLSEPRAKEVDKYSTFELQFLGFVTQTKPLRFAIATGIMVENYSGEVYWEHMGRFDLEFPRFGLYAEGRFAADDGIAVRSEGVLSAYATLNEWNSSSLKFGCFFSSALYYETVPVENAGFNLRLAF